MHINLKKVKPEDAPDILSGAMTDVRLETEFVDGTLNSVSFYKKDGTLIGKFTNSGYKMEFLIPA